jgi:hypothetical protein
MSEQGRMNEWFVPGFGPPRFRAFVGLLFLPYTGMCVSFTLIGAMLSPDSLHWDRVGAIVLIYFLALGIGAHAADAMGSKKSKPWGRYFTHRQLAALVIFSLAGAYSLGIYYIVFYVPMLALVAFLEGLFLFAYNFEIWNGRFHTNFWFAVSWGILPVIAGYVIQTGSIYSVAPIVAAVGAGAVSMAEIRISRQYKILKKEGIKSAITAMLEKRLKLLSIATIAFSLLLLAARAVMA